MRPEIYNLIMERISTQLASHLFHHITASNTSKINFYLKIVFELKICIGGQNLLWD